MSHNIMFDETKQEHAMFCVGDRRAAWHGLGQRTTDAVSWQDAMRLAGLDWRVEKKQLAVVGASGTPYPVAAWGIFRMNGNGGKFLGAVGEQYTPIQNEYAFDFVDTLLENESGAHYESAGALGNGERIWALARIPHDFDATGNGDKVETYLMFATSHDGSLAATCKLTTVRVVCQNTLTSALNIKSGDVLRIKHTKDANRRLELAKRMMLGAKQNVASLSEKLRALSQARLTRENVQTILERIWPKQEDKEAGRPTWSTRTENIIADVLKLYETSETIKGVPGVEGTAYGLLNAVTEWTDYLSGVRETDKRKGMSESAMRAENALFGSGEALKQKALSQIEQVVLGAGKASVVDAILAQ